jgi:hypothetical protein
MEMRYYWTLFIVFAVTSFQAFFVAPAFCTVEKELKIESVPTSAEVYLRIGRKKIALGKTPLVHKIEFHSEISIVRMLFEKDGHESLTVEVSASQDIVAATLKPLQITAEPSIHKDQKLCKLQERLNPIINKTVLKLLEQRAQQNFDLAGPIRVSEAQGNTFLVLPVFAGNLKDQVKGTGKSRYEMLLKILWNRLGGSIILPLSREIQNHDGINGILLEVKVDEKQYVFDVKPSLKTEMNMECVPGYKTEQVLRFRQIPQYETYSDNRGMVYQRLAGYRTESYMEPQQVYDPCAYKAPVAKTVVKYDPKGSFSDQAIAKYFLPFKILVKEIPPEELYEKLGILLTDSKGSELMSQGSIPNSQTQ